MKEVKKQGQREQIVKICRDYVYDCKNTMPMIKSPGISLVCKLLGIKYSDLSRLGKQFLKMDMATTSDRGECGVSLDADYYLSAGKPKQLQSPNQ